MKTLKFEAGFLGLKREEMADAKSARAAIVPFGLEHTVSWRGGTSKGPRAILSASHQVELFDEELWCEPIRNFHVETMEEPDIPLSTERALDCLARMTGEILDKGAFPLVFGGEHAITPGAIRPFVQKWPDLVILHFDAHADLRDGYEGEHYSHASAIRRCLDAPHVSVISVGVRNISSEEAQYFDDNRHRIDIHWAKDKSGWDIESLLSPLKGRKVYLTFDLDCFDASQMPATGTPEPGGLFWPEVLTILKRAFELADIAGADINELSPSPALHGCDFLAAKLAYKILSYKFILGGQHE